MSAASEAQTLGAAPGRTRRLTIGRVLTWLLLTLLAAVVAAAATVAYGTYSFDRDYSGRILPGASVAGVDISGMTRAEALDAARAAVAPQLDRRVTLRWQHRTWATSPRDLGARSDAQAAVAAAVAASESVTWEQLARMRWQSSELGFAREVAITRPDEPARALVQRVAKGLALSPRDAEMDYSTGWIQISKHRVGRQVRVGATTAALTDALDGGASSVEVFTRDLKPAVTTDAFSQVLLVRRWDHQLYLYTDGKIDRQWTVATGTPEYPTPSGVFEVTELRYMPTWINPDPDGWGADMPESIGPGYANPLGLRAINWSAPAIRFHGTQNIASLGTDASHGCVRMSNGDVIELYDVVKVGTPIVSL